MAKDILLYMSDQHSYRLQGYAGDPIVRTPNLDRLARTGVAMANAQPLVKERADYVTRSNDEDGVLHVIQQFMQ